MRKIFRVIPKIPSVIKEFFFWDYCYDSIKARKIRSAVISTTEINEEIRESLILKNIKVVPFSIDVSDFEQFLQKTNPIYRKFHYYTGKASINFTEKALEHYLADIFLNFTKDDTYIDIANAESPVPEIYHHLHGCEVYRQDLIFPEGIHGNVIGGSADKLPLKNNFASKMALHCSFEHFENDSDVRFIPEAERVLKKGGKLCIVPLYLHNEYAIQTDPAFIPLRELHNLPFEKDATIYCAKGWSNRHGRSYDVEHFINRIVNSCPDLNLTIYYIKNEKEINPRCYVKFVAVFEKTNPNSQS
jgi:SAM-dependent methyltransferase